MGLFTSFLAYRAGKSRARRKADEEVDELLDFAEQQCDNCGHRRSQHSDDGRCPTYN